MRILAVNVSGVLVKDIGSEDKQDRLCIFKEGDLVEDQSDQLQKQSSW